MKFSKRLFCVLAGLIMAFWLCNQFITPALIDYRIKHSCFSRWYQTISVSDIEYVTFSDLNAREIFPEPYFLSDEEIEQLVNMLRRIDEKDIDLKSVIVRANPVFTICISMGKERYLFNNYEINKDIFLVSTPVDDYSVGSFNKLFVNCPGLSNFVISFSAIENISMTELLN